jgi:predicted acylesterase/phospholipase RssA
MSVNVFLTGGGMKGAYQYGFFKQLRKCAPHIKINKLYSASVGALNAIPILTNRIEYLEQFWESDGYPAHTMLVKWQTFQEAAKNKTIFKCLNIAIIHSFLNTLSSEELQIIKKQMHIISYNVQSKSPIIFKNLKCNNDIVLAIQLSSGYPHLVPQIHPYITDGAFVTSKMLEPHFRDKHEQWIILDITGTFNEYKPENSTIYHPSVVEQPLLNLPSTLITCRKLLDVLIDEGMDDANHFMMNHVNHINQ